jgi:transposase-like protein
MAPANRKNPKRAATSESRYSLEEFAREYPDDEACLVALWRERYSPDGEHAYCPSPSCKQERTFRRYDTTQQRQSWTCTSCGHHLHPTAGTIFHKSSTSLRQWFYCMYLMTSTRCGISAKQVERELGCAYKTALRMMRLIRTELMDETDGKPLEGEVEADEAYIGGKPHAYPRRTPEERAVAKARMPIVLGMVERNGRARTTVIPFSGAGDVQPPVVRNVKPGSRLYTDDWPSYRGLELVFDHQTINHSAGIYADGTVHTQTIEGFWATVKNGLRGVFHGVSREWLQSYLNEYCFRYNHRTGPDPFRVLIALAARPTA